MWEASDAKSEPWDINRGWRTVQAQNRLAAAMPPRTLVALGWTALAPAYRYGSSIEVCAIGARRLGFRDRIAPITLRVNMWHCKASARPCGLSERDGYRAWPSEPSASAARVW